MSALLTDQNKVFAIEVYSEGEIIVDELEKIQHEAIKNVFRTYILNCPNMSTYQKQQAMDSIDDAAKKADWIIEMFKRCGYL